MVWSLLSGHARHPLPGRTGSKKHVSGLGGALILFGSSQHRVRIEDSADISAWLRSLLVSWISVCSYWKPGQLSWLGLISSQLIKRKVLGRCQIHSYLFAIKVICSFLPFVFFYWKCFVQVLISRILLLKKNLCIIPLREYCNVFCLLRKQKRLGIDWIRVSLWMKL